MPPVTVTAVQDAHPVVVQDVTVDATAAIVVILHGVHIVVAVVAVHVVQDHVIQAVVAAQELARTLLVHVEMELDVRQLVRGAV
jgi:hypothetical protein